MTPTWYIQSSISYHTLEPLHDAFEALDMTYVQVPTIPFKQELPDDIEYISPAIPFGGCSFVRLCIDHLIMSEINILMSQFTLVQYTVSQSLMKYS